MSAWARLLDWLRTLGKQRQDAYEPAAPPTALPPLPPTAKPARLLFDITEMRVAAPYAHIHDLEKYVGPLNSACWQFRIDSPPCIAAFLAQVAHESLSFSRVEEQSSGKQYEGRIDLGNTEPGDGPRFKGHGLIQITGRWNHVSVADGLDIPFEHIVPYLLSPLGASMSAAWYWHSRNLNTYALQCTQEGFDYCTRAINGGLNGKVDRDRRWRALCAHLGVEIQNAIA